MTKLSHPFRVTRNYPDRVALICNLHKRCTFKENERQKNGWEKRLTYSRIKVESCSWDQICWGIPAAIFRWKLVKLLNYTWKVRRGFFFRGDVRNDGAAKVCAVCENSSQGCLVNEKLQILPLRKKNKLNSESWWQVFTREICLIVWHLRANFELGLGKFFLSTVFNW